MRMPSPAQHAADRLGRKKHALRVAGLPQPHHKTVAVKRVLSHALNRGQLLDAHRNAERGAGRRAHRDEPHERPQAPQAELRQNGHNHPR